MASADGAVLSRFCFSVCKASSPRLVQETKLQWKATEEIEGRMNLPDWHFHWACSDGRKGYSGTATISKYEAYTGTFLSEPAWSKSMMRCLAQEEAPVSEIWHGQVSGA